jgi:hypothetical protein
MTYEEAVHVYGANYNLEVRGLQEKGTCISKRTKVTRISFVVEGKILDLYRHRYIFSVDEIRLMFVGEVCLYECWMNEYHSAYSTIDSVRVQRTDRDRVPNKH